jgi:hypothetical protein
MARKESEAHLYSSLHTAGPMAVIPTTAQKTALYSLNPRERWSKTPTSFYNNHRLEK